MDNTIICLMGPTAVGKTDLAVRLVEEFPCEIISVDSAMVYRGMDIGTAKPTADILARAPHALIDIKDPADAYSAAEFCVDAQQCIEGILARNKIPLLVGGTMMYFRALQFGLANLPSADEKIREALFAEGQTLGWPTLHARLALVDPLAASRIHPHDVQRIQRALEIYQLSGKTMSSQHNEESLLQKYSLVNVGILCDDRAELHRRIEQRFAEMLAQGFIDEVQTLFARGDLNEQTPSMRSVGYRQVWQYLANKLSFAEMQLRATIATRQLAKRQMTWLRHWRAPVDIFTGSIEANFSSLSELLKKHL